MSITRVKFDPNDPDSFPKGRINYEIVDSTTEEQINQHQREDEEEAMKDMGRHVRRVRGRLGLTQVELATRIGVPIETIRNWEQGKRCPTGAARALLKILDKAPEAALRVLT